VAAATVALAVLAACAGSSPRAADPARGRALADTWCSECHRVAPDQPSGARAGHVLPPPVEAPSFMTVAARPYADADYLRAFVSDLHLPMPTFRLSSEEKEDVVAYILSLR
jgi:mono/diheme cytochrome c family protein